MRTTFNPDRSTKTAIPFLALEEVFTLIERDTTYEPRSAWRRESAIKHLAQTEGYMGLISLSGSLRFEESSGCLTLAHAALSALRALEKALEEERAKR